MTVDKEFASLLGEVEQRLSRHGYDPADLYTLRRLLRARTVPTGPDPDEPGRGVILPPVSLPSRDELAVEARRSRRLWELYQVRDWAVRRRPVLCGQVLSDADATAFVEDFTIRPEATLDRSAVRGDDPAVLRLWQPALAAGAIDIRHVRGTADGRGPVEAVAHATTLDDTDDEVLRMWRAGFDWTLRFAEHRGRGTVLERHSYRTAERVLAALLFELYVRRGPLDMAGAVTRLLGDLVGEAVAGETMSSRERAQVRTRTFAAVRFALTRLMGHGAVRRGTFGNYELTPLGLWGMNVRLSDTGHIAPVRGSLATASAEALLRCLVGYTGRERMEEFDAWRGSRSDAQAVRELLTAADRMGPGDRVQALVLVDRMRTGVESAIREAASGVLIGPHCRAWLSARGHGEAPSVEDRAHVLVDEVIAASRDGSPEEFVAGLRGLVSPAQYELIPVAARIPHPSVPEMLRLLFELHPDWTVTAVTGLLSQRLSPDDP
ncbi:hypothetical protein J4H86_05240 [Spiractinospora alimapuensis]|uniref:hypothetical protein n=1 Tax=Spiractinospora alimapuensis TaxID=2820884 RepID=UPI001F485CFE|nr:hypothetical protein [Spiractinospora alimapuensis]QVQ53189.1 hypothetical protein J4H86_05240 [Spiractinospora alimapuensis]